MTFSGVTFMVAGSDLLELLDYRCSLPMLDRVVLFQPLELHAELIVDNSRLHSRPWVPEELLTQAMCEAAYAHAALVELSPNFLASPRRLDFLVLNMRAVRFFALARADDALRVRAFEIIRFGNSLRYHCVIDRPATRDKHDKPTVIARLYELRILFGDRGRLDWRLLQKQKKIKEGEPE